MRRLDTLSCDVDRNNMVDWLRAVIATADALPRQILEERRVSPAGVAIDAGFDDGDFATAYCERFRDSPPTEPDTAARISVLTAAGLDLQAEWTDPSFLPCDFHVALKAAQLRAVYPFRNGLWRAFDLRSGAGMQWCATRGELPPWDFSAPLRQHLHWILEDRGMRLAHAATLGLVDRGVVLFGRGGAGKSGTTLAGLAAGLSTVGDDYIALGNTPAPSARALYRTVKQDRQGLSRIPGLASRMAGTQENWRGKIEFDPSACFDGALIERMPIRAAILPRIAHLEKPALVPVRPQAVMLSLMTSNLHQFAGEEDNGMQFFAKFLKDMPCFQLDLSPDAVRNGGLLRDFVERLPG